MSVVLINDVSKGKADLLVMKAHFGRKRTKFGHWLIMSGVYIIGSAL